MKKTESELIIEQLAANTTELLNDYWKRAENLAVGLDEIKIGVIHSVTTESGKLKMKSTISFGRRIKSSVEHELDPNQPDLDFSGSSSNGESSTPTVPLLKRSRKPKALLASS